MAMSRLKIFAAVLGTFVFIISYSRVAVTASKDALVEYNLTESEYLALEGGYLLPQPDVVAKITNELQEIRTKFPAVREIYHNRKWIPGQVLSTRISSEQISKVNSSSYGPLTYIEKIDVMPFFYVTILTFNKPYSPPVLSDALKTEFDLESSPNTVYYEYEVDNIAYRMSNATYTFKKGTDMCKDNCPDRKLWEFGVDDSGQINLVKEWSVPQNGERVVLY